MSDTNDVFTDEPDVSVRNKYGIYPPILEVVADSIAPVIDVIVEDEQTIVDISAVGLQGEPGLPGPAGPPGEAGSTTVSGQYVWAGTDGYAQQGEVRGPDIVETFNNFARPATLSTEATLATGELTINQVDSNGYNCSFFQVEPGQHLLIRDAEDAGIHDLIIVDRTLSVDTESVLIRYEVDSTTPDTVLGQNIEVTLFASLPGEIIVGPPGAPGEPGEPGEPGPPGPTVILSGTASPTSATGMDGDFYLDVDDHVLYGPRLNGFWPVAISQGAAPGGGGGIGGSFEQSFAIATSTWVVNHNLGTRVVEVNCYDLLGVDEIDAEVDVIDPNQVVVHWYNPTAGLVRVMA